MATIPVQSGGQIINGHYVNPDGTIPGTVIPDNNTSSTPTPTQNQPFVWPTQPQNKPIPTELYDQTRQKIVKGEMTPQEATSYLQSFIATGQYTGTVDVKTLLPAGTVFLNRNDGTQNEVNPDGSIRRTTAKVSTVTVDPKTGTVTASNPVQNSVQTVVDAAVASGQINPTLTAADINNITWQDFFNEAKTNLAPQFNERITTAINDFLTTAKRSQADLEYNNTKQQSAYQKNLESGQETLSNRGLAFSGQRNKFEGDLAASNILEQNRNRDLSFNTAQDALNKTEQQIGTTNLASTALPSVGGRSLALGGTPLVGSDTYTAQSQAQGIASDLASQRRNQYTADLLQNDPTLSASDLMAYNNLKKIPA